MAEPLLRVACDAQVGPLHLKLDETLTAHWTVLFGPSGSGKSTVLRLIAGLWSPPNASVHCRNNDLSSLPAYRRRIGLVAQQTSLFPHFTVYGNVAFGCANHPSRAEHIASMLELFELTSLSASYPAALSGGEQQRVALARALAAKPKMLLLDEAFTGMHREQQHKLIESVRNYSMEHAMPVVSVTHDIAEAFACSDEVLRIEAGSIIARGVVSQVLSTEREALLAQLAGYAPAEATRRW